MSQVVGLDMVTGMGFIGLEPGRLYKIGQSPKLKDQTASGNPLLLNSAEAPLTALTVYGWSKQDGTPSPDNPVPIVSAGSGGEIGVTVQGGNLVNIPDIPAGDGKLNIKIPADISAPFVVSVDDSDVVIEGAAVWRLKFDFEDGRSVHAIDKIFPMTINANPENKVVAITYRDIRMASGTYRNFMINYGSTPLPYEPYKQPQTLTVSTPGGLPGIPVDASKLPEGMEPTYVDESGQAWVCDEVDFKRGKYVQRVQQIEMDGSSDERWTLQSINQHGIANFQFIDTNGNFEANVKNVFCDRFMAQTSTITDTTTEGFYVSNKTILYVRVNQSRASTVEDFVNWLGDNPIVAIICIATPIETDLSDEEMAAYKALHTYSPATTVSNDADVRMGVGYKK